jgi:outer membrane receptor protein involved in Fe transport
MIPNNHMKKLLLILSLLIPYHLTVAQANSAKIVGTVTDSVGAPITYATVSLLNTSRGTATDSKGNFTLSNLPAGSFNVVISAVGFNTQKQMVELAEREIKELTVSLKTARRLLNEVVVTSRRRDERKENLTSSISVVSPQAIQELQTISNNPADRP